MIDLHAHLLPGIDDGPPSLADALAMARAAVAAGTSTLVCTPHMTERYGNPPARVATAVEDLQGHLGREEIPLELRSGGEIALPYLARLSEEELGLATLGGASGRWLLLEMPFRGVPLDLGDTLHRLELRGLGAVLAHPERSEWVQRAPNRLQDLVGRGALLQLNAPSLTGRHGRAARQTGIALLRAGLAHLLASDGHSASARPPELRPGLEAAAEALGCAADEIGWMVDEGPRLVIEGQPVRPPRLVSRGSGAPRADARPVRRGLRRPTRR